MSKANHLGFELVLVTALAASLIPTLAQQPALAGEEAGVVTIQTATPKTPTVDQPYTFTVFVNNDSVDQRVDLVDLLPASASLVSATPNQGSCDLRHGSGGDRDAVECTLGVVPSGSTAKLEIVVTPRTPGVMTNTATATPEISPATAANSSSASVTVKPASEAGT
jgi:uncharacterized repeat protein (TIGR01451 family)